MKFESLSALIAAGKTRGPVLPGVEYLVQHPKEFIELVKQDIVLADRYAGFFRTEHIEQIVTAVHKEGQSFLPVFMRCRISLA